MTYKEFCESQDLTYRLTAHVNGEEIGEIEAGSVAELELHELDNKIDEELTDRFNRLPESQADAEAAVAEDREQQEKS